MADVDGLKAGDVCRAKCTAPARYLAGGKCLFVSAMCNDLTVDDAAPAAGGEERFPLPSDADVAEALRGAVSACLGEDADG